LFVGALASPDRGREEEPARPAAMQDRFRSAWQQAVDVCRRQQRQQPSHNTGMQGQQHDGAGPSSGAAAGGPQPQPPFQAAPITAPQQGAMADVVPPGGFLRLLVWVKAVHIC
jgi:hypothetical protein